MHHSILSDLAAEPSPSADSGPLHGSRAHFGDPAAELVALREGAALLDATDEGCVRIAGPDAADFLQRVLAGDVRALAPGDVRRNLLLSAKGKVRAAFELVRIERDEFLAACAPGAAADLAAALERYHIAEDLVLEDRSAEHAPLLLLGPESARLLRRTIPGAEPPPIGRGLRVEFGGGPLLVVHLARYGTGGFLLDAGPRGAAHLWRALLEAGARPSGRQARELARIAAGEALHGIDLDEQRYPQEARLDDAFSLSKGCYVGQEVVAKLDTYGGLQRALVVLESDSPLSVGDALLDPEGDPSRELGQVASSAPKPGGGWLALAYVRLERGTPGTLLSAGTGRTPARVLAPRR